ncbi:aminotransferase class IV [Maridesulfovibrio sp.]|uniref:aminotransferase class IV n=1 Tax=Maridesulfovibrio sp. TaxID=2795000 RepID=UPI002A188AB6|nr:aminotransferase class IV [Maridesulfovibrio sp.]
MIYYSKGRIEEGAACLDISQPAFRSGYGFFETICWNGHKICHLDLHIDRVRRSLAEFKVAEETVDYAEAILEVIEANSLAGVFSRINVFYPVENGRACPIITAVPFEFSADRRWKLIPSKEIFLSNLMRHKTMNRIFYLQAWQTAKDSGFDDALLTDFESNVLESSVASLLFSRAGEYYEPDTPYKLPGTARDVAAGVLEIKPTVINLDSIEKYDHVYALNSLGGMIPVTAIGKVRFKEDRVTARKLTAHILEF